jgi:hypothetical protein
MGHMATRRKLSVEAAVKRDLMHFPPYMRTGAIATQALILARRFDNGTGARDACLIAREVRLCIRALSELAPLAISDDPLDEVTARRERRLTEGG